MANVRLANQTQQDACDAVAGYIDTGTGAGTIEIRDGTQPANANLTATGTLLATLTFQTTAFGAADTSGVATVTPSIVGDTSADASGTASWARIKTSGSATVFDCDVTNNTGTGTIKFDSVNFQVGGTVDITAFTITHPDGV